MRMFTSQCARMGAALLIAGSAAIVPLSGAGAAQARQRSIEAALATSAAGTTGARAPLSTDARAGSSGSSRPICSALPVNIPLPFTRRTP